MTSCGCFDHGGNKPTVPSLCRLSSGNARVDESSNGLTAYVSNRAPQPPPPPPPPVPAYSGPALYLGTLEACPWLLTGFDLSSCNLSAGEEAHCVVVQNGSLVATGNTTRGAIFALFEMAEVVLGVVDPWWRFTMNTPPYLGQINISTSFASIHPPPAFRYRGFFTNDKLHQPPTRPCALH